MSEGPSDQSFAQVVPGPVVLPAESERVRSRPSESSQPEGGLSQLQRIVDTFIAPSRTFTDIRRNASWWAPFLLSLVFGMGFTMTAIHEIGYEKLTDGVIAQSASLQNSIDSATPAQAALIRATVESRFQYIVYSTPAVILIVGLLCSAVLLGTVNFGLGGEAKFGQMVAVWFYGTLPLMLISLLAVIAIFAGLSPDNFNIQSPVGTNIGYYIPSDSPQWLKHLLDSADVFSIWSACLLTIGVSITGKVKRGAAAAAVFGWWVAYVLLVKVALAGLGG